MNERNDKPNPPNPPKGPENRSNDDAVKAPRPPGSTRQRENSKEQPTAAHKQTEDQAQSGGTERKGVTSPPADAPSPPQSKAAERAASTERPSVARSVPAERPSNGGHPPGPPEGSAPAGSPPEMREWAEPQKFYRWVGVHEKELDGLAPKQVDAKFGEEARKGNWFSTEPLTHTQATMDMGIRPEWPQDKVLRCYEYEPPSGTESYEGAARRQPYGDTGDGTRARSDLVGGGTQAYIPNDGTRDDWKIRRVDLDMPAGSTRTDSPVRVPVERFGVESRNPFDEISEKNREKDVHDPSRIENCYSGPIEKYVQP